MATSRPLDSTIVLPECKGIFASDLIIRHMLILSLADLRANSWQLEKVYASLLDDPYTINDYGQKTIQKAKDWIIKTDIPVVMKERLDPGTIPCLSVELLNTEEAPGECTLADIHYQPEQDVQTEWEPLTSKFTPSYDPKTGNVVMADPFAVTTAMVLVDGSGGQNPVLTVTDTKSFTIAKGLNVSFNNSYVGVLNGRLTSTLESENFRESYRIGCHVTGEAENLIFLHNAVVYCLLRYKKLLLEGRGFERSAFKSGPIQQNQEFTSQPAYSRYIDVTGYCRQYWAPLQGEKMVSVGVDNPSNTTGLRFSKVNEIATKFKAEPDLTDPEWWAQDGIGSPV